MSQSRRNSLNNLKRDRSYHAGLWLDKYIGSLDKEDKQSRRNLVDEVASIQISPGYTPFFARWKGALNAVGARSRIATVQGRMVVGLGDESVLETSVALHHTYGVPYIPGSALKGLAASYARQRLEQESWGATSKAYKILFGDTENAGYITFYDALYVPDSGHQGCALYADVITVHHPEYYQGDKAPPADWDSPTPIPFLSATGQYLLALAGPSQEWTDRAFGILQLALGVMGIGAKTSSGYGRLRMEGPEFPSVKSTQTATPVATPVDPDQARVNTMIQQVKQLRSSDVAGQIANYADRWSKLEVAVPLKLELAQALLNKVREAGREKVSSEKPWYQKLKVFVEQNMNQ